jgi:plasmid stabilization system protein ParE
VARVTVTPRARGDVDDAISALGLPVDTWSRIAASLRILEDFPLAGRALEGRWREARFVLGPWPWMILVYLYRSEEEVVYLVAVYDARSSTAATGRGS